MLTALWLQLKALARSGRWPAARRAHLLREPACQGCGERDDVEVHHITPLFAGGDELEAQNLITFCRDCHFVIGHGGDWTAWRPECRAAAGALKQFEVKRGR